MRFCRGWSGWPSRCWVERGNDFAGVTHLYLPLGLAPRGGVTPSSHLVVTTQTTKDHMQLLADLEILWYLLALGVISGAFCYGLARRMNRSRWLWAVGGFTVGPLAVAIALAMASNPLEKKQYSDEV